MTRSLLLSLAFLAGCPGGSDKGHDTSDTTSHDGINHCAGSNPGDVPGFEDFIFLQVEWSTGEIDAANWAWKSGTPRTVTVNVDSGSFSGETVTPAQVKVTVQNAMDFWNDTANIDLVMGDDDLVCCQRASTCDRVCGKGDTHVDIFLEPSADEWGFPAYTESTLGDDPVSSPTETGCLVGSDVNLFPSGISGDPDEHTVSYNWVNLDDDVSDYNDDDGTVDKPLHNTLVHELGHVLGLGDQADASVGCSVMSHCLAATTDPSCGCNFDTIESLDETVLTHLYGP